MDLRKVGWAGLGWLVGAGFAIVAFRAIGGGLWKGGPFMLLASLICLPPVRTYIARKVGVNVHGAVYAVAFVALASIGISLAGDQQTQQAKDSELAAQDAMKKRMADKRAAAETEFQDNKAAILAEAQRLYDAGDYAGARTLLGKFSMIGDPDLVRIRDKASLILLRKELEQAPSEERQAVIYSEISRIDPADKGAKSKATEINLRIEAERNRVANKLQRESQIKRQFSGWDGAHPAVERAIKDQMKNPDSYQHVETRYIDTGYDNFTVFTRFRGTNSFNAVVTNTATATVSPGGQVLKINVQ